jgi:hypothetical protein
LAARSEFLGATTTKTTIPKKMRTAGVVDVHGPEDWIEMRSKLQWQLKMLESSEVTEVNVGNIEATLTRINKCIGEQNCLLKEYTRDMT